LNDSPVSSNTNQAIWVGIGQLSSFFLSLISAAILARYFTKTDYGTYKQVLYIYNTLLILFSAGLQGAYSYFLPKQTMEEGKDFVYKLIRVFTILGLCFSASLFLLAPLISTVFRNPDLAKGLRIFSAVPVLMFPIIGIEGVYASLRKTHVIAIYTTLTRLLMLALITLPVLLLKGTYLTALYGWIAASLITCALALYLIMKPYTVVLRGNTSFRYEDIFKYSMPLMIATIYGILIRFADQFFISRYYGTEVFAEFSNGFIDLPFVSMITGATVTVLLPLFSRFSGTTDGLQNICLTWKSATERSVILVYPILAFFVFNAKNSVIALYGEQYAVSAVYFVIGMLIGFFNIIVFQSVLFALGKTRVYARIHLIQAILIWVTGFLVVRLAGTPVTYAILSRLFYIGQVCLGIIYALKVLGVKSGYVIPYSMMIRVLLHSSLICGLTGYLTGLLNINTFITLGLSGLISAILILLTGDLLGIPYRAIIKSMLLNAPGISLIKRLRERLA
jgi:O-antigen/teichoic acid export membrane protein